jgi:hypothetical protein
MAPLIKNNVLELENYLIVKLIFWYIQIFLNKKLKSVVILKLKAICHLILRTALVM